MENTFTSMRTEMPIQIQEAFKTLHRPEKLLLCPGVTKALSTQDKGEAQRLTQHAHQTN